MNLQIGNKWMKSLYNRHSLIPCNHTLLLNIRVTTAQKSIWHQMKSADNTHFYLVYYGSCDEARHNRPKTCCCRSAQQKRITWKPALTARMDSVSDKNQNINWGSVYHSSCNNIWDNKEAQSKAGNLPIWGMWQRMGVQTALTVFAAVAP